MATGWLVSTVHEEPTTRLTAVAAWGDEVVVGTSDGLLLHFAPPAGEPSAAPVLQQRVRVAAEHAIVQACAAEACGALVLLLADGTVSMRELPSLKALAQLERGVDCTSIAMLRAEAIDGYRLAAAGQRKLVLYRWRAATAVGVAAGGSSTRAGDGGEPPPAAPTTTLPALFDAEVACFVPLAEVALPEPAEPDFE